MKRIFKEMLAWILCVSMISGSGGAGIAGGLTTYAAVPVESVGNMASGSNAGKSSGMMDESGASLVLATADNAAKKQNTGSAEVEEIHLATASDALYGHRYLTSDGIEIRIETADSIWPDDTLVKVEKVTGTKQKQITDLVEKALTEDWGKVSDIFAYDISFWSEGEEFEPEGNVEVTFRFPENEKERFQGNAKIFHIKDEAKFADIMPNETETEESVSCLADEFSVYGVALVAESDYIPIYSSQELHDINHDLKGNYILMNDIDLSGWGTWEPIGNSKETVIDEFRGNFDGNGHTISNLRLSVTGDSENIGLFGKVRFGSVKNLTLSNVKVEGTATHAQYIGALAGYSNSVISSCRTDGNIDIIADRYDTMSRTRHIGGMTGYGNSGISDCVNDISIKIHQQSTYALEVGGIAGGNYSQIEKSINNGSIKMSTENSRGSRIEIGGIAGHGTGEVEQCANYGMIEAVVPRSGETEYAFEGISSTVHIGGIQGVVSKTVRNCYNAGDISLSATCKNMGKRGFASLELSVGGILGEYGKTETCYNIGQIKYNYDVQSPDSDKNRVKVYTGSIAGYQASGAGGTCYYYKGSHAIGVGKIGDDVIMSDPYTGLTNSQMQIQETYEEFDFDTIWKMGTDMYLYPIFQWQEEVPDVPDIPDIPDGNQPLTLVSVTPPSHATGVKPSDQIILEFNKDIISNLDADSSIYIRDYDTDEIIYRTTAGYMGVPKIFIDGALTDCQAARCYIFIPQNAFLAKLENGETGEILGYEYFEGVTDKDTYSFWMQSDKKVFQVTYDSMGGSEVGKRSFQEGSKAKRPVDPVKDGYLFTGWFTDRDCTVPFDFETLLYDSITLYAGWQVTNRPGPGPGSDSGSDSGGGSSTNDNGRTDPSNYSDNWQWMEDGSWKCLDKNQQPFIGYQQGLYWNGVKGNWYFDENGKMLTGWIEGHYFEEKSNGFKGMEQERAAIVLGSYTYAGKFVEDVKDSTGLWYSLKQWKQGIVAITKGTFDFVTGQNDDWTNAMADAYTKNPDANKAFLADIVNKMFETETWYDTAKYKKEVDNVLDSGKFLTKLLEDETYLESARQLAENMGFETETKFANKILSSVKNAISTSEEYEKMVMDYTKNQQYLQQLEASVPTGSTLERAIRDLEKDYEEQMIQSLKGIYKSMLDELKTWGDVKFPGSKILGIEDMDSALKSLTDTVDKLTETKFEPIDSGIQLVTRNMPSVSAVDKVIFSVYLRQDALMALREAEAKANSSVKEQREQYASSFRLAKEITIVQYENMLKYYQSNAYLEEDKYLKINALERELDRLHSATENGYAGKNSDFKLGIGMTAEAGLGGGSGGGRGF